MGMAFIGSVGLPNRYGGFESFLEACAPLMAQTQRIIVTCDANRYSDHSPMYRGVERVFVPVAANGAASIVHDIVAFLKVFRRADTIVVLGVSAGIAFPVMRLLCSLAHKKLIVNVDGVEWRRAKFSPAKRLFLKLSDRLAQKFAHRVIVDNVALIPFLIPGAVAKTDCIAYSGDQVVRSTPLSPRHGGLTICRIEPENNCGLLLEAVGTRLDYHFVGNWGASDYGRQLRQSFASRENLTLTDPVYDQETIAALREQCAVYLHGHSVGGTNPSLVEMLYYDCHILAYDCAFNRETAGAAAAYFSDIDSLRDLLANLPALDMQARSERRAVFTRETIAGAYRTLAGSSRPSPIKSAGERSLTLPANDKLL